MANLELFDDLVTTAEDILVRVSPRIDPRVRALCVRPYPLHPRGCPNVGKCDRCPPIAPLFGDAFDLERPVYAVVNDFDLAGHVTRMRERNPAWSDRQLRCVLYWQSKARKQLASRIDRTLASSSCMGYSMTWCPEGMGVDVTTTLSEVGIDLEWPPIQIVRQVALLGVPRVHR